jgi:hypothetical protein
VIALFGEKMTKHLSRVLLSSFASSLAQFTCSANNVRLFLLNPSFPLRIRFANVRKEQQAADDQRDRRHHPPIDMLIHKFHPLAGRAVASHSTLNHGLFIKRRLWVIFAVHSLAFFTSCDFADSPSRVSSPFFGPLNVAKAGSSSRLTSKVPVHCRNSASRFLSSQPG